MTAVSRMKPAITETTTAQSIPVAAERDAWCVSSAMWADASYPVSVYWAMPIEPIAKTIQNTPLLQPAPENPELLTVSPNT